MEPLQIHGLTSAEMVAEAKRRLSSGAGKALDVYKQVVMEGRFAPEELGLSERSVAAFREAFRFELPEVVSTISEEGPTGTTAKAVLRLQGGLECECVHIPMGRGRSTLCISSQVGCKMGCTFCETARMGLIRHLDADEITAQLLTTRHRLGWDYRNVVFMGMGEALDNADSVLRALRIFNDPAGMAMGQERVTVCTVGNVDGIRRLGELGFKRLNVSLSLNAANDELRRELMPVNKRWPLAEVQAAFVAYRPRKNFVLGVNYCLMPGMNDSRDDAAAVARFCEPIGRVLVNVIPYNPGNEPLTRAPEDEEIDRFIGWLKGEGLAVRRRITKGRSVMAACGQLGNVELREERRRLRVTR